MKRRPQPNSWKLAAFGALLAAAAAARFSLAWTAPVSEDLKAFAEVADILRAGEPLYESTHRYNYSPLWSWAIALGDRAARGTGVSFPALLRSFLSAVDLATAALLFLLARRIPGGRPRRAAALFLANPVTIWVSSVQGQFDNVSLLFLLLAVLVSLREGRGEPAGTFRAGVFLFLSVAVKHVTALHPILWLRRRTDAPAVLASYLAVGLVFLPSIAQWKAIRDGVLLYRGVARSYGFSEWVLFDARWAAPVAAAALAAGVAAAWRLRREDLPRGCLLLFLVLLFFAPGLGAQYLVWPLTFGALFPGARYFLCTVFSTMWILGSHYGVPGSGRWMGHLVWLSVALWILREVRALGGGRPAPERTAA